MQPGRPLPDQQAAGSESCATTWARTPDVMMRRNEFQRAIYLPWMHHHRGDCEGLLDESMGLGRRGPGGEQGRRL